MKRQVMTSPSHARANVADAILSYVASVDYETDRKIQDTIAYEFKDRTILCIARKSPGQTECFPYSATG